jgi:hypothetical protein
MLTTDGTSPHAAAWFVEPDDAGADRRGRKRAQTRQKDDTSMRAVIVSTLFLVVIATAIMFGGHVAVDPLLRMATAARESVAAGDVMMPMPDGKYCRHMSFDNKTSEMHEGAIAPCPDDIVRGQFRHSGRGFSWSAE